MSLELTLGAVGLVEALWGGYVCAFPSQVLTTIVGRLLSVDASPALMPTIAQTGALRLALGVAVLAVATSPGAAKALPALAAAIVAHACIFQPLVAMCRTHPRLPVRNALLMSLFEGACIVGMMALDADFDVRALADMPTFLVAAGAFLLGVVFALFTCMRKTCCASSRVGNADGLSSSPISGAEPLILDENRFQLSPASKRLLS